MQLLTPSNFLVPALLGGVAGCSQKDFAPAWTGEPPPNVLFLSIDTLRADHLGFYGYEKPTSPRLDAFASQAVVFDRAIASSSWTLPALATAFTSTYSSTHHCWSFGSRLGESFTTLPEILTAAGYDSACFVSHLFCTTRHGLQQGFVHFDDAFAYPEVDPDDAVTSQRIADEGIRFLERKSAASDGYPWFLWLHFFDPHENYVEHPGLSERFASDEPRENDVMQRDRYDGEIAFTDQHVGRVLDALEHTGLAERTIVVFFADHGEEFHDHGAIGHGHSLFEELVRVPLALRAPGIVPRRVPVVVRTVDLLPTVLDLLGIRGPDALIEGQSLRPLLEGRSVRDAPALLEIRQNPSYTMDAVVAGRWKLVRPLEQGGTVALYDLEQDSREERDVASEYPEKVEELQRVLLGLRLGASEKARGHDIPQDGNLTPAVLDQLRGLGYYGEGR